MRNSGPLFLLAALTIVSACRKDDTLKKVAPPVSFNVIHAMPTADPIVSIFGPDTVGKYFSIGLQVYYGMAQFYSTISGQIPLRIAPITDTTHALYNKTLDLTGNGIYSLFLTGDNTKPDTLLTKDNIPVYTDSSAGVRFVNLAIGGKSLNINLPGDAAHPITSLGYLHIGDFMKYPANPAVGGSYAFEIRDAATGDSLTTYTWAYTTFRSSTIVISGSTDPASPTPLYIFPVNNY